MAVKKGIKGMNISSLRSSAKGDIVWAKAFPKTWYPGQIRSFNGRRISVSLFGFNKTLSFKPSEILPFEEAFPQMAKLFGLKLSYEICLALDVLSRNIAVGLKCCCSNSSVVQDRSLDVKMGFKPQEILDFVHDKAVSPQVSEEKMATAVRVLTALNTYRSSLAVCKAGEVDEGFCAESVLDFVLDMAVSLCHDDKAVAQLLAFRRFGSLKPNWLYHQNWEFEEDSLESYEIERINALIKPQQESESPDVNHKQDMEKCSSSMQDFMFFDINEKYESLSFRNETVVAIKNASLNCEAQEKCELNTVDLSFFDINEKHQSSDFNECVLDADDSDLASNLRHDYSNHMLCGGEEFAFKTSSLELTMQEESSGLPANSVKLDSVEALSSAKNKRMKVEPTAFDSKPPQTLISCTKAVVPFGPLIGDHHQKNHLESILRAFYASPLRRDGLSLPRNMPKFLDREHSSQHSHVLLNMKFPKDFVIPSKEELEKKFSVFGPLNQAGTKIFFYTGVGQVVFLHRNDAVAAYNHAAEKRMFGKANVRFYFYVLPLKNEDKPKSLDRNKAIRSSYRLFYIKFPKDYNLPSVEELEKKLSVFGPLDRTRTRAYLDTRVARAVFFHHAGAVAAYNYLKKNRVFGHARVCFWLSKTENCNKAGGRSTGNARHPPEPKSCLVKTCMPRQLGAEKKSLRVSFSLGQ